MSLTVELGSPFEAIINKIMDRGYAASKSEVIRQALILYEREVDEEEIMLVKTAIESMMADIRSGKTKTYTIEEIEQELGL